MSVANLNIRIDSPAALAAWLRTQPRPAWSPIGATYHNTYKPTLAQWRGAASMQAMARHYESQGWTTGPHLFLALGTTDDGIWVMTPPSVPGTHAGPCNARRFGIEVVGDYGATPMSDAQVALLGDCAAELLRWAGAQSPDIVAHRDCMPGRTCPGDAAYAQKDEIQARLARLLRPAVYTPDSPLLGPPGASASDLLRAFPPPPPGNEYTRHDRRDIVQAYCSQAAAVGLDPVIALAQLCHETGPLTSWWSARPRRNPAGIGVTGEMRPIIGQLSRPMPPAAWQPDPRTAVWRAGLAFTTWVEHAIPAHLGRLLAYALPQGAGTPAQQALITRALSLRALRDDLRGCAPTLQGLEDTWATDGDPTTESQYAERLAAWANRLASGHQQAKDGS